MHVSRPTKKGYHKGCFGSPTRKARKVATERISNLRSRAYRHAVRYVKGRIHKSKGYAARMKDEKKLRREVSRVAQKHMKKLRAHDNEKRTSGSART